MYNIIINGIQEFFYFDIWESFLMMLLMTIMVDIKISKEQYFFHTIMIGILDLLIFNLTLIPIIQQIIGVLVYAIYFVSVFRINFTKSIIKTTEIFFIFFIIEMIFSIIMQYCFHINLMTFSNNILKFEYMIPLRMMEFILIYIIYKYNKKKVIR